MQSKSNKVLLVEDDTTSRAILVLKLTLLAIDVDEAANGALALDKIRAHPYKLVLLDLRMPVKDGFQVLEEMGADQQLKKIPVWVLSNLGQKDEVARAMKLGAKEYFIKADLDINALARTIADFLQSSLSKARP